MDIQQLFAERIGGVNFGKSTAIYKFAKIKMAKDAALSERPDIELLDFGVGEPDQMAPAAIREALKQAVDDPANRGYSDNGISSFITAAADYMSTFFDVHGLDATTQINHSIGSKPALAMLPLAFVDPGDVVLTTVPGYPVLATHAEYLGADVVKLPLKQANGFFPDLDSIDPDQARRAKLFYVNYPNNPTGAAPTADFYDRLIAFADKYNILVVQDAAYATLVYDSPPLSILGRPGGSDVAIELHSMSKSYNMTGWRLGFVAGAAPVVSAFASVKDNVDSGQFKAIQIAACQGIANRELADSIRDHYARRLRRMSEVLCEAGFDAAMPGGTFFLYTKAPTGAGGTDFANAEEATQFLIRKLSIATVPWDDAGAYVRFSATFESSGADDDDRVLSELGRRLSSAALRF
jgi:LL-diaminopimelate aminotransferase